jgi:uncharacterized protein
MEHKYLQFIFIIIFFSIYLGMHYYIGYHTATFLGLKKNLYFHLSIILFSSLYLFTNIANRFFSNNIIDFLYIFASILFGVVFLLVSTLLIYDLIKIFYPLPIQLSGIIIICIVFFLTVFSLVNTQFITVKEISVPITGLSEDTDIVQLSDIHLDTINQRPYLERIVSMTNSLDPSVVVITGDIVDGSAKMDPNLFSPLNDINAPTFFVHGNHEFYEGIDSVERLLRKTKVNILRNEVIQVKDIQFAGIDDPTLGKKVPESLQEIELRKELPVVLLSHQPSGYDAAAEKGIHLMLSGHTHKGQIFPFNFLVRLQFKYVSGLHKIQDMYLYVSSGTGVWGPPMRLGSKNEITLLHLKKTK